MSTPTKKSEPEKKTSPTSVADLFQEPAFEDPYILVDSQVKDKDVVITEDDPAVLFASHRFVWSAMIQVAGAPNPPTFLGSPELPADSDELTARIIAYCQARIGGAGANLDNHLLYNLSVGNFGRVCHTLAAVRFFDPYIAALRQELGGPVVRYHYISGRTLIEKTLEL